jgi:serine/threonine protein kinase
MKYQRPNNKGDIDAVETEIKIIQKLKEINNWENIVEFYDIFPLQENRWIFTMLPIKYDLFKHLMSEGRRDPLLLDHPSYNKPILTQLTRLKFIQSMINGIHVLHQNGIFHQDIKSDNLLVGSDDVLKFTDSGLSSYNEEGNNRRRSEHWKGTSDYMSPDLVKLMWCPLMSDGYDRHTNDLWALMVVIFEIYDTDWWWSTVLDGKNGTAPLDAAKIISSMSDGAVFKEKVREIPTCPLMGANELDGLLDLLFEYTMEVKPATTQEEESNSATWKDTMTSKLSELNRIIESQKSSIAS